MNGQQNIKFSTVVIRCILKHYMFRSSRWSSGVYFIYKFKTQGKNVNFCDVSQIARNRNYDRLVTPDGVSFNTNDVLYNMKILGYSFLIVICFKVTIKSFLFPLMLLNPLPPPSPNVQFKPSNYLSTSRRVAVGPVNVTYLAL